MYIRAKLMRKMRCLMCVVLTACLVCVLGYTPVVTGQKGTVTCESFNNEYHHCYADTKGKASLKQKLSMRDCVKGRSWGFDDTGIWVDRGCRAEFEYGRDQEGGSNTGRNVAIAAGVASAIALAVIISKKKDKNNYDKLSDDDKIAYNKGWDSGKRDHSDGKNSDYTRWRDQWNGRESAFRSGYSEGYEHGENRKRGQ